MERPTTRHTAPIARCLGRGQLAPLGPKDMEALVGELDELQHPKATKVFAMGEVGTHVFIVREGTIELTRSMRGRQVEILDPDLTTSQVGAPA